MDGSPSLRAARGGARASSPRPASTLPFPSWCSTAAGAGTISTRPRPSRSLTACAPIWKSSPSRPTSPKWPRRSRARTCPPARCCPCCSIRSTRSTRWTARTSWCAPPSSCACSRSPAMSRCSTTAPCAAGPIPSSRCSTRRRAWCCAKNARDRQAVCRSTRERSPRCATSSAPRPNACCRLP